MTCCARTWLWIPLVLSACEKPTPASNGASHAPTQASAGAPAISQGAAPAPATPATPAAPEGAAPAASVAPAQSDVAEARVPVSPGVEPRGAALSSGEASTSVTGCLASASGMPERSLPATKASGKSAGVEIVLGAKPKVVHQLTHACCLRQQTRVERSGQALTIVEELSGNPCRCQCASTLSTELALPPGKYELRVVTVQAGARSEAFRGDLEIATPSAAPASSGSPRLPKKIHVPAAAH
ncbi:MAG: hypothetical protein ACOY0T_10755 [Myxococcota bacterium]